MKPPAKSKSDAKPSRPPKGKDVPGAMPSKKGTAKGNGGKKG